MPELSPRERLLKAIQKMAFDDAINWIGTVADPIALSPYHLEFLYLKKGWVQYRLYTQNELVGIASINNALDLTQSYARQLGRVQVALCNYLLTLGLGEYSPTIVQGGIITALDAVKRGARLPLVLEDGRRYDTDDNDLW